MLELGEKAVWISVGSIQLTLKVVVVWVLSHAAVEEGPCEVVNSVLLVFDGSSDHLSTEVVVKEVVEMGLRGQAQNKGESG